MYLVGIGASAGGLAAITSLVENIDKINQPVAYVIIQHLAPDKKSYMRDILADKVRCSLQIIQSGDSIDPNTIYLTPPGKLVSVIQGRFVLTDLPEEHSPNRAIDSFLRSVAQEFKERSIGIILSGSGSDGVKGCQEIYEVSGEVFVQTPEEAEFTSMPESVIQSGFYSKVVESSALFSEIRAHIEEGPEVNVSNRLFDHVYAHLDDFSRLLNEQYSVNFKDYKYATICRRIAKRMMALKLNSIDSYLEILNQNVKEKEAVFNEIMIAVTSFFRDPDFYKKLSDDLDSINLSKDQEYRVWSAGCSQGEEAYSLMIMVNEKFESAKIKNSIKIFATDINPANIEHAAKGIFSHESILNIPEEYREKYFNRSGDSYIIKKSFREMIIFSRHDLLHSPPFSNMDLVVCRNLLIYFNSAAQSKSLVNLVFSLKVNGTLALGPSESLGVLQKYFSTLDRRWRIFKKNKNSESGFASLWDAPRTRNLNHLSGLVSKVDNKNQIKGNLFLDAFEGLYPDSLIINDQLEICAIFGNGKKLISNQRDGLISNTLDALVDSAYLLSLRAAIAEARNTKKIIQYSNIKKVDGDIVTDFQLKVNCIESKNHFNIFICEVSSIDKKIDSSVILRSADSNEDLARSLKSELDQTKIDLQSAIAELGVTNEELQTTNEELIASNEELQSTNEELNSVNEELYTLNGELQQKIDQVSIANDDITNLINTTQVGVIFLDRTCRIRRVTSVVEDIFYIRISDIGRNIFELDFGVYLEPYKEALNSGKLDKIVFDQVSRKLKTYLFNINPYFDDQKFHEGYVISIVDISDSVEREQFMNDTQSDAKIGGWVLDLGTKLTKWTKQVYELYEVPYNIPTDIAQGLGHYSPKDKIILSGLLMECASSGRDFDDVFSFTTSKGKYLSVRVTGRPVKDAHGVVSKIRGTIQDVTEKILLDERMSLALSSANLGIWDWNIQAGDVVWDDNTKKMYAIFGNNQKNHYQDWLNLVMEEDRAKLEASLQSSLENGSDLSCSFRVKTNDEIKFLTINGKLFFDLMGRPNRMIGICADETQKNILQEKIDEEKKMNFQNARLSSIGELSAGVGHEINNPLAIIMGHSKMQYKRLQDQGMLTPELERYFQNHQSACLRIRDIVNGLRVFAREPGLLKAVTSVNGIIEALIFLVVGIYSKEGIEIVFEPSKEELFIDVNSGQVQQVIMNLLSNAKDALENQRIKKIEISIKKHTSSMVEIAVADTGMGISKENIDKIFDTFYTSKPVGKGTGLGLSISKKIVEDNGGMLNVRSQPGVGSTFSIKFDLCKKPLTNSSIDVVHVDSIEAKSAHIRGKKILIVEDEIDLREIFQDNLEELGFYVSSVSSGLEAIEVLREKQFDLLMSDMRMPGMNGFELINKVKSEMMLSLKCIIVTGGVDSSFTDALHANSEGNVDGFLLKPFNNEQLLTLLLSIFEGSN